MLVIIVVYAIFHWLEILLHNSFKNKIQEASDVKESLNYRKKLKNIRLVLFGFLILFYGVIVFFINFCVGEQNEEGLFNAFMAILLGVVLIIRFLKRKNKYDEFIGNISTVDKNLFLSQNADFAIFLRGFERDDYSKERELLSANSNDKFSEYKFMKILQTQIPACAIGMTKETDSPYGATRVYVDDTTWKEDVKELMEKASIIYILVNDKPSCIWEIEQSRELLEKTVLIIDAKDKYENVRNNILRYDFLPNIPEEFSKVPNIILRFENKSYKFEKIENSIEGYTNALRIFNKAKNFQKDNSGFPFSLFLIVIIVVITYMHNCNSRNKQYEYYYQFGQTGQVNDILESNNLTYENVILKNYTSKDEYCSIKAPVGFKQIALDENQRIALTDNSETFSIYVVTESKNDLATFDVTDVHKYAKSIIEFYQIDWETDSVENIVEETWERGCQVQFTVYKRGDTVNHRIYTLEDDEHLIQIVFVGLSHAYNKLSNKMEEMANSFTVL